MARAGSPRAWTYARSGVDRTSVQRGLSALLASVTYRPPKTSGTVLQVPGHYAGMVRIGRETIAITTDTVGTKVLLAEETGRWEGLGEDIVAVNVNDLAAVGARPCGLVDCISLARPRGPVLGAIGRGLDRGLRAAGCGLLGGETAVVPDLVSGTDLGGTAIGFFPRGRRPVLGDRIRPGDRVLGIPSSGFHANGYTLVRRLVGGDRAKLRRRRPGASVSLEEELLAPTRIYVRPVEAVVDLPGVHGLAHISGGGVRNLVRLNRRVRFVLDTWPAPTGLFEWARVLGRIPPEELYQTFNVGIGFVIVVAPTAVTQVTRRLRRAGAPDVIPVGRIARGSGVDVPAQQLRYAGYA
ncbi:MAG: phosphoribosylformylglycinamidine cyclo-ligase [Thermoplasmata archaeon]|nr:phosphoribosylformylglycinamidine cyclo-ligase [Thermoplasmata archaeon]MCI4354078.1 phosphoribosylformylglycinamidine cyclo-ligase [Thermoplasmata archaeon]